MTSNRFSKNLIIDLDTDRSYAVLPRIDSSDFYFVLPVYLNSSLSRNVNKIQIVCQNANDFTNTFKSMFFSSTTNYKKYDFNDSIDMINNDIMKNIYLDYNKKNSSSNSNFTIDIPYNEQNFIRDDEDLKTNKYNIIFPLSFSKKLVNNEIKNARIMFVDSKNSIVDESDIIHIDFERIKTEKAKIEFENFYRTHFLNDFASSCNLNLTSLGLFISSSSSVDANVFNKVKIKLSYDNIVSENTYNINTSSLYVLRIDDIAKQIALDTFVAGQQNTFINIVFELESQNQNDIILNKQFIFNKESSFVRTCLRLNKQQIVSDVMSDLNFRQENNISNNRITVKPLFDRNIGVLDKIYIIDIQNNNSSLDTVYTSPDIILENMLDYKGKSLLELFDRNDNQEMFYFPSVSRESTVSFKLRFLDVDRVYTSEKIILTNDYRTSIDSTNKIFKRNFQVSNVNVNISLNDSNKSVFSYDNIYLSNFNNFSDLSYSLGYITDNQADVLSFLENCLVKIENTTVVSKTNIRNYKTNYFFLKDLFDMSTFNNDIISIKPSYITDFIATDDYFRFTNTAVNKTNEGVIKYFTIANEENAFKFLLKLKDFKIENKLTIKLLPIPKIISDYRGYGLDDKNNPISEIHANIADLSEIRNRLMRELVVFIYTGNSNFSWPLFNKVKALMLDETKTDDALNYALLFDSLFNINVDSENIFSYIAAHDKSSLLSLTSTDSKYINSDIFTTIIEEDLYTKYFNFAINNNEIFCDTNPYSIMFKDLAFISSKNEYETKKIEFMTRRRNNELKFNIDFLKTFYNTSKLLTIEPKIRLTTHFLLYNNNNLDDVDTSNSIFEVVNTGTKNAVTYNKQFVDQNRSNFSNFSNNIDKSLINVRKEGQSVFIVVNTNNASLDMNSITYTKFLGFFQQAKNIGLDYLEKVLIRVCISFEIPNEDEYVTSIFNIDIPSINLDNKKINISKLSKLLNAV